MRTVILTLFALAMFAGLVAFVLWLRSQWEEQGRDSAALAGAVVAGLIVLGFIVWGFHLPSWIGDNYFSVNDLTEELRTACVQVHNYTRIPETDHCIELGKGEDTIFYVGLNEYRVPNVPRCELGEVIVGTGSYEDGYWADYECQKSIRLVAPDSLAANPAATRGRKDRDEPGQSGTPSTP